MLPDPLECPTIGAREVAAAYGIGLNAVYAEGNRFIQTNGAEGIPAMRFGRTMRFPTAAIRAHLGLAAEDPAPLAR